MTQVLCNLRVLRCVDPVDKDQETEELALFFDIQSVRPHEAKEEYLRMANIYRLRCNTCGMDFELTSSLEEVDGVDALRAEAARRGWETNIPAWALRTPRIPPPAGYMEQREDMCCACVWRRREGGAYHDAMARVRAFYWKQVIEYLEAERTEISFAAA
jgi:hypothetical protein